MSEQCATCKGIGCAAIGRKDCGQYQPTMDSLVDGSDAHLLDECAEFEQWWKDEGHKNYEPLDMEGMSTAWQAKSAIDAKRIEELESEVRHVRQANANYRNENQIAVDQLAEANQKLAEQKALAKIMAGALETCMEVDTGGTNKDQMFNLPSVQSALRKYYIDEECEPLTAQHPQRKDNDYAHRSL